MRDFAEVRADGAVNREWPGRRWSVYDVDELGLDRLDRAVLERARAPFGGGPVGVSTLAVAVGEEAEYRRGGLRALPRARRDAGPHAARPGRHRGGLGHLGRPAPPASAEPRRRCSDGGPADSAAPRAERRRPTTMDISLLFPILILLLFIPIFLSGRKPKRVQAQMQSAAVVARAG